jgi:hypothetical protein
MASRSGLAATWGFGEETTPGTAVAPSRWFEFTSEGFSYDRTAIQGQGMRGSASYGNRANRRVVTEVGVTGSVAGQIPTRGIGLLLKHMLGATPIVTQQGTTTAYLHTYPVGDIDGKSLTVQKKVPDATGASRIFTYNGCKISGWEIACAAGEIATVSCDFDGWNETTTTAYTTPSYAADASVFSFKDGTIYVGGTVAVTGGVAARTGGTAVASVTGVTISGSNAMKTDRRFFGNAGVKAEQLENDYRTVGGSFETEFTNMDMYNLYTQDTKSVCELRFVSAQLAGAGFPAEFRVLLPAIYLNGETPQVGGPDVVTATVAFDAFEDVGLPLVQAQIMTADSLP